MILGTPHVDYNTLQLDFGQYCHIFYGTSNTQAPRSIGAIALHPKNTSGSYYFMSLETGKQIHSNQWKVLAITDAVIKRVEALAELEGTPPLIDGELQFEWSPGSPILDHPSPPPSPPTQPDPGLMVTEDVPVVPIVFPDPSSNPNVHAVQGANSSSPQPPQSLPAPSTPSDDDYLANKDPFDDVPTLEESPEPQPDSDNDLSIRSDSSDDISQHTNDDSDLSYDDDTSSDHKQQHTRQQQLHQ